MNEIDGVNLIISLFLKNVLTLPSLQISFWFQIMHCCIPTPTIDNNSSTGMIRVTLNMGRTAVNHQGLSHCLESGHLSTDFCCTMNCMQSKYVLQQFSLTVHHTLTVSRWLIVAKQFDLNCVFGVEVILCLSYGVEL